MWVYLYHKILSFFNETYWIDGNVHRAVDVWSRTAASLKTVPLCRQRQLLLVLWNSQPKGPSKVIRAIRISCQHRCKILWWTSPSPTMKISHQLARNWNQIKLNIHILDIIIVNMYNLFNDNIIIEIIRNYAIHEKNEIKKTSSIRTIFQNILFEFVSRNAQCSV